MAFTRMGDPWGEYLTALDSRLPSTWTMRRPVGHDQWQVRRKVHLEVALDPGAQEPAPGLVHHVRNVGGSEFNRQRSRLDAGRVQQVADQVMHVVNLLVYDPVELDHHCRVQVRRAIEQGAGGTLDGGQRCAQLVADHAQELGPQPFQVLQGCHVLQGDDEGLDLAILRADGRCIEQRGYASTVGGP